MLMYSTKQGRYITLQGSHECPTKKWFFFSPSCLSGTERTTSAKPSRLLGDDFKHFLFSARSLEKWSNFDKNGWFNQLQFRRFGRFFPLEVLFFNGSLLHGVIPNLSTSDATWFVHPKRAGFEGSFSPSKRCRLQLKESHEARTTLMLGLWGHQPSCFLASTAVSHEPISSASCFQAYLLLKLQGEN